MAKMRVYDLAKELGIESKQIIETLNTTEYAVKAASSNIDDPAQDIVRKKFGKSAAAENTAKAQKKMCQRANLQRTRQQHRKINLHRSHRQTSRINRLRVQKLRTQSSARRKNQALLLCSMHSTANRAAAAAAITTDVLEMVTDARGMATAVHRDRIQTAAMRRQDRHPVMM